MRIIPELLAQYADSEQAILDYFGFAKGWNDIPIRGMLDYFWSVGGHTIEYAETEEDLQDDTYFTAEIESHAGLTGMKPWTLIVFDTRCDGNKYIGIFDTAKRREPIDR